MDLLECSRHSFYRQILADTDDFFNRAFETNYYDCRHDFLRRHSLLRQLLNHYAIHHRRHQEAIISDDADYKRPALRQTSPVDRAVEEFFNSDNVERRLDQTTTRNNKEQLNDNKDLILKEKNALVCRLLEELLDLNDCDSLIFKDGVAMNHQTDLDFLRKPSTNEGSFEVKVNLRGCDPEGVKVEVKDGLLKVEGRKESPNGGFTYIRHEQTIPKEVPASSLKASLLPEGVLNVRLEPQESKVLQITVEEHQEQKATEKSQQETNSQEEAGIQQKK